MLIRKISHHKAVFWIVIILLSVGARVAVALYYGNWVPVNQDDYSYSQLAWRLATGHGYSFDRAWYPFTPGDTPTAHWSFLYTSFVAAIYFVFGYQPVVVRLVGAVATGILLPPAVHRLALRIFNGRSHNLGLNAETVARVSAASAAFYAYHILFAARIMTEGLYTIALLWSLDRALQVAEDLRKQQKVPFRATLLLGVSLGMAALLRQAILPWVPVLFAWLFVNAIGSRRLSVKTLLPLFSSGMILLLAILPWTVRNYRVFGSFLLLNSNTGYAMYSAQHPMHDADFQEHAAAPLPDELRNVVGLTEPEWDRALMARGIAFVLQDPGRYVLLSLSRILDFFEFWPTANTPLLHNIGRLVSFTAFLPFMLYGAWLAATTARRTAAGPMDFIREPGIFPLGFSVFYAVLHILTWAMPRYRIPVDAVMLPYAALALYKLYVFLRQQPCPFKNVHENV